MIVLGVSTPSIASQKPLGLNVFYENSENEKFIITGGLKFSSGEIFTKSIGISLLYKNKQDHQLLAMIYLEDTAWNLPPIYQSHVTEVNCCRIAVRQQGKQVFPRF